MTDQASGPSGFDWLNAVWSGSETRGEVTLNSQIIDSKSLALATQMQAALGSTSQEFYTTGVDHTGLGQGDYTIAQVIAIMGKTSSSSLGALNSVVANMQQEQSLDTQTAGQGVQASSNQVTQVDSTNQTSVVQLLGSLVSQQNQWGGFQIN